MTCSKGHICQCLSRILTLRRGVPVTISGTHCLTGEQFVDCVLSLAGGLTELGLQRGDVVAIAALNSEWYVEWLLAVAFVGCIAAPLNYRWSFKEARSAMELVKPVMLVVDESCSSWALQLQRKTTMPLMRFHVLLGESPYLLSSSVFPATARDSIKRPSLRPSRFNYLWAPDDIALICFTSGTTGRPKGVAISHMALIVQSLAKIAIVGYGEEDVYLHTAPLCHIGGISSCIAMLMAGGCHVFIPKFDAQAAIQAIEQYNVTSLITVPAIMVDLISFFREHSVSGGQSIKKILNGGGDLSFELIRDATRIFPNAKLISAYGMTEACSSLTFITLHNPAPQKSGNVPRTDHEVSSDLIPSQFGVTRVGKSPPHIELWIGGTDCSSDLRSVGSILTRGPHVMTRYWHETLNATMFSENDWLDTGDLGWIDDNGDLWLVGRTKDCIKSGGENIFPEEVEAVISQHPGVSSVVVVGVPDSRLTKMVVACVCLRDGWVWSDQQHGNSSGINCLSSDILRRHCRENKLTGYKIPKICLLWIKPFPITTTGKLKREEVRREATMYLQNLPSNL